MNKKEFQEFYKKNKVLAIGVPVILGILIMDHFVLKPRRQKPDPTKTQVVQGQPQPAGATAPDAAGAIPPKPPDLVNPVSSLPKLSMDGLQSRFSGAGNFPYSTSKNIFTKEEKRIEPVFSEPTFVQTGPQEVKERPEIKYHGFFTIGTSQVAILKLGDRMKLTKVGEMLRPSPFRLKEIRPDRIVIVNTEDADWTVEVSLADKAGNENENTERKE